MHISGFAASSDCAVPGKPPAGAAFDIDSRAEVAIMQKFPGATPLRRFFVFSVLVLVALLAWSTGALAQSGSLSPETRGRIQMTISRFLYANGVPGISAAVLQNGQPVWSEGFGLAD